MKCQLPNTSLTVHISLTETTSEEEDTNAEEIKSSNSNGEESNASDDL
jgi:hypothetical protein